MGRPLITSALPLFPKRDPSCWRGSDSLASSFFAGAARVESAVEAGQADGGATLPGTIQISTRVLRLSIMAGRERKSPETASHPIANRGMDYPDQALIRAWWHLCKRDIFPLPAGIRRENRSPGLTTFRQNYCQRPQNEHLQTLGNLADFPASI